MTVPRYRLNYKEGDVFAVPLEGGGYALGVAARLSKRPGCVLGYFFGPRIFELPAIAETKKLSAERTIWIKRFGDLGLVTCVWPILGKMPDWDSAKWPVPVFGGLDVLRSTRAQVVEYDPNDISTEKAVTEVDIDQIEGLPTHGLAGAGSIESKLSEILPMM